MGEHFFDVDYVEDDDDDDDENFYYSFIQDGEFSEYVIDHRG